MPGAVDHRINFSARNKIDNVCFRRVCGNSFCTELTCPFPPGVQAGGCAGESVSAESAGRRVFCTVEMSESAESVRVSLGVPLVTSL